MTKRLFAVLLALLFCGTAGADLYVNISTTSRQHIDYFGRRMALFALHYYA